MSNLVVILNDNGMSISASVGALSRYLSGIRTKRGYLKAKKGLKDFLDKAPLIGPPIGSFLNKSKAYLKNIVVGGGIFQKMGFNYIGPMDGHDLPRLIRTFERVREMDGPILVHLHTTKGKGYGKAEDAPDNFHGVGAFNVDTGKSHTGGAVKVTYSDVFGGALTRLAAGDDRIIAITAAMPDGTGLTGFAKLYPRRFFDVGIAESHAVTFAAGLAKQGAVPVFAVYSTFLQRAYDQLLHDICLQNLHVVLGVDRAGIVGADGETHQGLFDVSFLSHMPNMTVMCPKDARELEDMLELALRMDGPCAIRYPRGKPTGTFSAHSRVRAGKAELLRRGDRRVALVALGVLAEQAQAACRLLEDEGHRPTLYNARFAKPLDMEMVHNLRAYDYVFTIEENVAAGGFGERLRTELALCGGGAMPVMRALAFPDMFIRHAERSEILAGYGLDGAGIGRTVKAVLEGRE